MLDSMAEENMFVYDRTKALAALSRAKAVNAAKTVPFRVDAHTVVYITPEQSKDNEYMARLKSYYRK